MARQVDPFYHYTTRELAQEIIIRGELTPGRSGRIYLTDILYRPGWQATDYLALPDKNAEVAFVIPRDRVVDTPRQIKPVLALPGSNYRSARNGGARQWVTSRPIDAKNLTVFELEVP